MVRLMVIGGQARNNGIDFYGDNYKVSLTIKNDHSVSITNERQPIIGKIDTFLSGKPVLRTIGLLLRVPVLVVLVFSSIIFDIFFKTRLGVEIISETFSLILTISLLITSLLCLLYVFKTSIWKIKQAWKFHGAEHKTIFAVKNNIKLDYDEVRKCPRISNGCGTNIVVFMVPLFAIIYITANYVTFLDYYSIRYILPFIISYELFCVDDGDNKPILKYFYRISFWLQERFYTTEPEDFQLQAAISAVKVLIDLENNEEK